VTAPAFILPASELRAILSARYPFAYLAILDADYTVPSVAGIGQFNNELASHLFSQYGDKWQEYFDCDNFGLEAVTLACRKHWVARQAGHGSAQGIAFGLLCYRQIPADLSSGHCINWWLDADKQIHEIEPQTRQPLTLTPEQCATASLCFCS
jgi:hypothetical protein